MDSVCEKCLEYAVWMNEWLQDWMNKILGSNSEEFSYQLNSFSSLLL